MLYVCYFPPFHSLERWTSSVNIIPQLCYVLYYFRILVLCYYISHPRWRHTEPLKCVRYYYEFLLFWKKTYWTHTIPVVLSSFFYSLYFRDPLRYPGWQSAAFILKRMFFLHIIGSSVLLTHQSMNVPERQNKDKFGIKANVHVSCWIR